MSVPPPVASPKPSVPKPATELQKLTEQVRILEAQIKKMQKNASKNSQKSIAVSTLRPSDKDSPVSTQTMKSELPLEPPSSPPVVMAKPPSQVPSKAQKKRAKAKAKAGKGKEKESTGLLSALESC